VDQVPDLAEKIIALYVEGRNMREIETRFHIAQRTIRRVLEANGVEIRPAGQRPRYPVPAERECAREGCQARFTPSPSKAAHGEGRYCTNECANTARIAGFRRSNEARRNGKVVACPVCGTTRYYNAFKLANGSKYCSSECFHLASRKGPPPAPRECPTCSKIFTPRFPAFADARFCSRECWGIYRWQKNVAIAPLVASMLQRKLLGGRARQRWLGRWAATKPPGGGAQPRGRPRIDATAEQQLEIEKLAAIGWGRRSIASRLKVSERMVRHVLESPPLEPFLSRLETAETGQKPYGFRA
jgi:hypothetical protein